MNQDQPHPIVPILDTVTQEVDTHFAHEEELLREAVSTILARLDAARHQEKLPRKKTSYILQVNALTSVIGAIEVWRRGLQLQVGVLLRNALETTATAVVVGLEQDEWKAFDQGKFKSSKAFTIVKKYWPAMGQRIGQQNGLLSNHFTHVSQFYRDWRVTPPKLEPHHVQELKALLMLINGHLLLLDQVGEATCLKYCTQPRYWVLKRPGVLAFAPSALGQQWIERFKEIEQRRP